MFLLLIKKDMSFLVKKNYGNLVRYFDKDKVEITTLKFSRYFPPFIEDIINECGNMYDYLYILCPVYKDKTFQVGVTGTKVFGEEYDEALQRELGEEIGLQAKKYKIIGNRRFPKSNKNTSNSIFAKTYTINILDAMPLLIDDNNQIVTDGKDEKNKKVGCLVFGYKKDILDYMSQKNIYTYKDNDNIVGITLINFKTVRKYYKI